MKKLYLDPEMEIVNIRLVADVLTASSTYESQHPEIEGGGMGDGSDDDWDNWEVLP